MIEQPEQLTGFIQRVERQRLRAQTVSLILEVPIEAIGETPASVAIHPLEVSLAYGADDILREVVFVGRGKIGQGLDVLLHDLGIKLSRAIQGRDPDTGARS